jgi:hypothetical protein
MKISKFRHWFFIRLFHWAGINEKREEQLATKWLDGTISEAEALELETLAPLYHQCPICNGAFLSSDFDSSGGRCSQCETPLVFRCIEIRGHQLNEIVESVPVEDVIGRLCLSFTAPGMNYCERCGTTYPKLYSCCPGLIDAAVRFHLCNEAKYGSQIIAFINSHSETMCNMLRGKFEINQRSTRHFERRILPQLQRAAEIKRILRDKIV